MILLREGTKIQAKTVFMYIEFFQYVMLVSEVNLNSADSMAIEYRRRFSMNTCC